MLLSVSSVNYLDVGFLRLGGLLKLLITGSNGLLGSAIANQSRELFDVHAPTRDELDLEDSLAVQKYVSHLQPDYCIHAAAHVYGLGGHKLHPNKALFLNSKIDLNLISALSESKIEHFVYVGTVASYGYPYVSQPLSEIDFLSGTPHASEYGYAMAKRFGFDLSNSLKLNGTTVTYAIMTNLFGPKDNFNEKTGHVIPSLIARAFTSKRENTPLQVWGNSNDSRDFLFSGVAATRVIQALTYRYDGLLNIGSGKERRILDVAKFIVEEVGVVGITSQNGGLNAIHNRTLNISLLEKKFGAIEDEFESNLHETISWYEKNLDSARR
jgi:GDP-L-fucose synthase